MNVLTHIHDSDTQSRPLLHILVMTSTPVLQDALADPHSSANRVICQCKSATLCPGSHLQDQSCFPPPPAYCYILLFLINPVSRLFLKFPEKMSLTFWNSVSGRYDIGNTKDLLCHFIWGAAEWSAPGRPHRVKSAPTIWSGGPTQPPPPPRAVLGRIRCEFQTLARG